MNFKIFALITLACTGNLAQAGYYYYTPPVIYTTPITLYTPPVTYYSMPYYPYTYSQPVTMYYYAPYSYDDSPGTAITKTVAITSILALALLAIGSILES